MPVSQIEQLIAHRTFLVHRRHKAADFVFDTGTAGAFQCDARRGIVQQRTAALHRPFQRIDHRIGPGMRADLDTDGQAEHVARPAEVDDLGLGRQRVGNHRHAALAGLQTRSAPIDVDDPAFGAVDGDPVIDLIRLGGVEHDPGKHITEGALQRQTDNDRQGPGRRQHTFDRQIQHVGQGRDNRDQENHRTEQILQQPSGVPDPLHHHRADQHGQGATARCPPTAQAPSG